VTVKQAAKLLGTSEWVVRHLCLDGKIPAVKRRKYWQIPKDFRALMSYELLESFQGKPNDAIK
jgi:excisionase family DNA binding protein